MKKNKLIYYDRFPTTTKNIFINDVWLAKFPYFQDGNMEKLRPVLINKIKDNEIVVTMITSKENRGIKINDTNIFRKNSYLTEKHAILPIDKLYRKIGHLNSNLSKLN